jgi:hypothetical protein
VHGFKVIMCLEGFMDGCSMNVFTILFIDSV